MFVIRQQKKLDKSWRSGANKSRSYMTDVKLLCMSWANLEVLAGPQKPSNNCCHNMDVALSLHSSALIYSGVIISTQCLAPRETAPKFEYQYLVHPQPRIHVSRQKNFHVNVRLRMYQYCYSNLGAIYAKGLWFPRRSLGKH